MSFAARAPATSALSQDARTDIQFKDPGFVQFYNGVPGARALEYIALSEQFYDSACINEQVKMQTRYTAMDQTELDYSKMTGVQYELTWSRDPVIHHITKSYKHPAPAPGAPSPVTPMAMYYVYQNCIYQAPDLRALLCSRLRSSLFHLDRAFHDINKQATFHPAQGFVWNDPTTAKQALEMVKASTSATAEFADDDDDNDGHTFDPADAFRYRQAVDRLISESARRQHVEIMKPRETEDSAEQLRVDSTNRDATTSYAGSTGTSSRKKKRKSRVPSIGSNSATTTTTADDTMSDTASLGGESTVSSASGFGLKRRRKSKKDKEKVSPVAL
ncbi:hypothetical protein RI367_006697 [Sorochytrium milnesiophthora]